MGCTFRISFCAPVFIFIYISSQCNGFSAGINPDDFRGPGYESGYDPVWMDLLEKHSEAPFHVLVGGGDQLYCDRLVPLCLNKISTFTTTSIMREADMQDWVKLKPNEKKNCPMSEAMALTIDRFYFNHYCQAFRRGAFARANSSMCVIFAFHLLAQISISLLAR